MLKPYKFLVVAVAQECDEDGNVIRERTVAVNDKPAELFGVQALQEWAGEFPDKLQDLEASEA